MRIGLSSVEESYKLLYTHSKKRLPFEVLGEAIFSLVY